MGYWQGDEYLDGARLAEWLERRLPTGYSETWPSLSAKMSRWRGLGQRAVLRDLEPVLCAVGIHPGEIPDDLWKVPQEYRPETCRNGHPYTPENTGHSRGARVCLTCERAARARWRRRRRPATGARAQRWLAARPTQDRALALRTEGMTWQAIADELGYSGPGAAYHAAAASERRKVAA